MYPPPPAQLPSSSFPFSSMVVSSYSPQNYGMRWPVLPDGVHYKVSPIICASSAWAEHFRRQISEPGACFVWEPCTQIPGEITVSGDDGNGNGDAEPYIIIISGPTDDGADRNCYSAPFLSRHHHLPNHHHHAITPAPLKVGM